MRTVRVAAAAPIALALLIAGCGSSTKSSSSASPSAAGASASSASTSSAAAGAYGQATGQSASKPGATALITTKHDKKLGMILADGHKRLTVYLFEADKPGSSSCTGACAGFWPPVTGRARAQGAATSADLGTIKRPDGRTQVTYKGHPLYLYVKDKDDEDAYGEGIKAFGAEWYALSPSGNKIDES